MRHESWSLSIIVRYVENYVSSQAAIKPIFRTTQLWLNENDMDLHLTWSEYAKKRTKNTSAKNQIRIFLALKVLCYNFWRLKIILLSIHHRIKLVCSVCGSIFMSQLPPSQVWRQKKKQAKKLPWEKFLWAHILYCMLDSIDRLVGGRLKVATGFTTVISKTSWNSRRQCGHCINLLC